MASGIYCIENIIDNKKYIGYARDFKTRWKSHRSNLKNNHHRNQHLQYAYNKYGTESFIYYIVQEIPEEKMKLMETYWIVYYDSNVKTKGYNSNLGGTGFFGGKCSEETRKKMSESKKGEKNYFYNKHRTEETKRKISENLSLYSPLIGTHISEKRKIALSKVLRGRRTRNIGTSDHVGISYIKKSNNWGARINFNMKRINLGYFNTEEEAIMAYEGASAEIDNGTFTKKPNRDGKYISKEYVLRIKDLIDENKTVSEICDEVKVCNEVVSKVKHGFYDCMYNLSIWSEVT